MVSGWCGEWCYGCYGVWCSGECCYGEWCYWKWVLWCLALRCLVTELRARNLELEVGSWDRLLGRDATGWASCGNVALSGSWLLRFPRIVRDLRLMGQG